MLNCKLRELPIKYIRIPVSDSTGINYFGGLYDKRPKDKGSLGKNNTIIMNECLLVSGFGILSGFLMKLG